MTREYLNRFAQVAKPSTPSAPDARETPPLPTPRQPRVDPRRGLAPDALILPEPTHDQELARLITLIYKGEQENATEEEAWAKAAFKATGFALKSDVPEGDAAEEDDAVEERVLVPRRLDFAETISGMTGVEATPSLQQCVVFLRTKFHLSSATTKAVES